MGKFFDFGKVLVHGWGGIALLMLLANVAVAQNIYKHTSPDGRVTYSDRPPMTNSTKGVRTLRTTPNVSVDALALPFELRQIVMRYPVTLYTNTKNCAPCATARSFLNARGIPFAERTITSDNDSQAFAKINPDGSIPTLAVGSKLFKGFQSSEWDAYLSAAGYPTQSKLPSNYQAPRAAPLASENTTATTTNPATPTPGTPMPLPTSDPMPESQSVQ